MAPAHHRLHDASGRSDARLSRKRCRGHATRALKRGRLKSVVSAINAHTWERDTDTDLVHAWTDSSRLETLEIERSVTRAKRRHAAPCFLSGGQVIRIRSYQHERARGTESQSGVYPVPVRAPPRSTYSRVEGQVPRCFCLSVWDRCLGHLLTRTAAGATGVRQNVTSRHDRRELRNYSTIVLAKLGV